MASKFRSDSLCRRFSLSGAEGRRFRRRSTNARRRESDSSRAKQDRLANALTHPKRLCTRTSALHFLSARPPPVHQSLLCYTHQCTSASSRCPGQTSQLALSASGRRKKHHHQHAQPGHTRELERWFNRPKAANPAPQIKYAHGFRRAGNYG
ncbi:hypothetical protein EDB85DRAFT_441721 [Lactarius pseudohatsudake]|nr:hypothetical protein EDB85DRAFT_441721 [Lactarius pseudohatsudake]